MKACAGHPTCSLCDECERYGALGPELVDAVVEFDGDAGWTCNEFVKRSVVDVATPVGRDDGQLEIW